MLKRSPTLSWLAWIMVIGLLLYSSGKALGQQTEVKLRIVNETGKEISIHWLSDGKVVFYKKLAAGESYDQPTFVGHRWQATLANSNDKIEFTASAKETTWRVTAAAPGGMNSDAKLQQALKLALAGESLIIRGYDKATGNKKFDEAIRLFDDLIKASPNNAELYRRRGTALRWRDKLPEALADLDKAIQLSPKDEIALNARGAVRLRQKQPDKAMEDFQAALRINPKFALAINNLGAAYADKKEQQLALDQFAKAIQADPKLALAYLNRYDQFIAMKKDKEALAELDAAVRAIPDNGALWEQRGVYFMDRNNWQKAIAEFTSAIKVEPGVAWNFSNRAICLLELKEYDKAIADCDAALKLRQFANVLITRGKAYVAKKNLDKAEEDFSNAIRLNPKGAIAYGERAKVYIAKQASDKALADLDQAIKFNAKNPWPLLDRGVLYAFATKDYDKAIADYTAAFELTSLPALRSFAMQRRGEAHFFAKRNDKALADFAAAIKLDPQNANAFLGGSRVYAAMGDNERARADRAMAFQIDPTLADQ